MPILLVVRLFYAAKMNAKIHSMLSPLLILMAKLSKILSYSFAHFLFAWCENFFQKDLGWPGGKISGNDTEWPPSGHFIWEISDSDYSEYSLDQVEIFT